MDPQQTPPQNPNDIDARIMAERHAAEAYQNAPQRVVSGLPLQSSQRTPGLINRVSRRSLVLVAMPLLLLIGIVSLASRGDGGNNAHKTNIIAADEEQSADGSLTGDYVVDEGSQDTNTDTTTSNNTGSTTGQNTGSTNTGTSGSSKTNTPSKTTKPTKSIKHPQPVVNPPIKSPVKPIVIGSPPVAPTPPPKPTPTPTPPPKPLKLGTLCLIKASSLNESSGLVASIKHPGIVYTHNDEKGPILAISISSCKVAGSFTASGLRSDPDPEAITIDRTTGKIWFGDIGNGHPGQPKSMTSKTAALKYPSLAARIVVFSEPSKFGGTVSTKRYDITYEGGMVNSEALLVNPKTGQGYIINKYSTTRVYRLPYNSSTHIQSGQAKRVSASVVPWVTDATFTNSGKYILVRYRTTTDAAPTSVVVYSSAWKKIGTIKVPKVKQGESITVERDGRSFLIGSEGTSSPLVRVALPTKYQ